MQYIDSSKAVIKLFRLGYGAMTDRVRSSVDNDLDIPELPKDEVEEDLDYELERLSENLEYTGQAKEVLLGMRAYWARYDDKCLGFRDYKDISYAVDFIQESILRTILLLEYLDGVGHAEDAELN